jgi:hypothetical protein
MADLRGCSDRFVAPLQGLLREALEEQAQRQRWLPSPKLPHPYPDWRFDVMTRGGSPVR